MTGRGTGRRLDVGDGLRAVFRCKINTMSRSDVSLEKMGWRSKSVMVSSVSVSSWRSM